MKGTPIAIMLLLVSVLSALFYGGQIAAALEFPELELPDPDFVDVSGGCSGFTDCTEYLANIIKNIGEGAIATVLFTFALIAFITALFVFFVDATVLVAGAFTEAPWYVSGFVVTVLTIISVLWLYRAATGNSEE